MQTNRVPHVPMSFHNTCGASDHAATQTSKTTPSRLHQAAHLGRFVASREAPSFKFEVSVDAPGSSSWLRWGDSHYNPHGNVPHQARHRSVCRTSIPAARIWAKLWCYGEPLCLQLPAALVTVGSTIRPLPAGIELMAPLARPADAPRPASGANRRRWKTAECGKPSAMEDGGLG